MTKVKAVLASAVAFVSAHPKTALVAIVVAFVVGVIV